MENDLSFLKMPSRTQFGRRGIFVILSICLIAARGFADAPFRVIAREQGIVPGFDGSTKFQNFGIGNNLAVLNNLGQVAFRASLTGALNGTSLWIADNVGLRPIAIAGQLAAGPTGSTHFGSFTEFSLADNGVIAFQATTYQIEPFFEVGQSIWFGDASGSLHLVATNGSSVPGTGGELVFSNFAIVQPRGRLNAFEGDFLAFQAQVRSIDDASSYFDRFGVFQFGPSGLKSVVLPDQPVPETASRLFLGEVTYLHGNSSGVVSFYDSGALWTSNGLQFERLLGYGDRVPGYPQDIAFAFLDVFHGVDPSGRFGFRGNAGNRDSQGRISFWEEAGIWTGLGATIQPLVLRGNIAPSPSEDFEFESFGSVSSTESLSAIVFGATVRDRFNAELLKRGVWLWEEGNLAQLVIQGDPAPGTGETTTFTGTLGGVVNSRNRVALVGSIQGSGVSQENDRGIWVYDSDGNGQLVVREGDVLSLDNGEYATLTGFQVSEGWFNDLGQILVHAQFTDAPAAIIVFDTSVVPEPGGIDLIATAIVSAFLLIGFSKFPSTRVNEDPVG